MTSSEVRPGGHTHTAGRHDEVVLRTITRHAEALLRTARRHSLCDDDAADAYQRAVELYLRNAHRVDPSLADRWLHVVTRREALDVRDQRKRLVGSASFDLDALEGRHHASPDERAVSFDEVARTAEAMQRLKPAEAQALWMKAEGRTYDQIADELGWSRTKVNRCITEGRKRLRARLAGIESGEECERWAGVLSAMHDGEASPADLAAARPHLRNCAGCRAVVRSMHEGSSSLGVLLPVGATPVVADPVLDVAVGTERSVGLGARISELLLGTAHERAVSGAVKVQALADAIGASKVTAVAASAAALAGGGVAVERAVDPTPPRTPAARAEPRAQPTAPSRPLTAATALAPVVIPARAVPAPLPSTVTPPTPRERAEARRRAARVERRRVRARERAREERRAADFGPGTVESPAAPSAASAGTVVPSVDALAAPGPGTVVTAPAPSGTTGGPGTTVAPPSGTGGDLLP